MNPHRSAFAAALLLAVAGCGGPQPSSMTETIPPSRDTHSYSNPAEVRVTHVHLDLDVDFARKTLEGSATLDLDGSAPKLILDTRDLAISGVEAGADGSALETAAFRLGATDQFLGAPLEIDLPAGARKVRVAYSTSPGASGLQWLEPAQTAGKRHPYLYSQSQAVHARSWIPLQDTPGVRATYSALIRTPKELRAVMSAEMNPDEAGSGEYRFDMPQAIPAYLIALAVGDLAFQPISDRAGVYSEPSEVAGAAKEFEDVERMMEAIEGLYGPYRWGRYDMLVLPPSFPYGGMENPRLTFVTPTLIAGDKSLVGVIAHELAHSWSGNLVTNATWRDFWLNEGFTVYLENRSQEEVYGKRRADMEAALELAGLREEMEELEPCDEILHVDLDGRDPDDGFTQVPYTKGMLLLRTLEQTVGREKWDSFLRGYFDRFAFESITTADFLTYLRTELPEAASAVDLVEWTEAPGLPDDAALPSSDAFTKIDELRVRWEAGEIQAAELPLAEWNTHERLYLLQGFTDGLLAARLAELDKEFSFTQSPNSEIAHRWILESVKRGYEPVNARLEEFLVEVGRRKYLKPLYEELVKTDEGKRRAKAIYEKARPGYHPIAQTTVDAILAEADSTDE